MEMPAYIPRETTLTTTSTVFLRTEFISVIENNRAISKSVRASRVPCAVVLVVLGLRISGWCSRIPSSPSYRRARTCAELRPRPACSRHQCPPRVAHWSDAATVGPGVAHSDSRIRVPGACCRAAGTVCRARDGVPRSQMLFTPMYARVTEAEDRAFLFWEASRSTSSDRERFRDSQEVSEASGKFAGASASRCR